MELALQAKSIVKTLNGFSVLDGVSLEVAAGELLLVLGASGCGKTTLLRVLSGALRPDSGQVLLDGVNAATLAPVRRGTALLPARDTLWPHLSARENVVFPLINTGSSAEEAGEAAQLALGSLSLESCADRRPEELSGGERQRVMLARTLATRPHVLLLDNPFSECDAATRLRLWKSVRRYCAENGAACVCAAFPGGVEQTLAGEMAVLSVGKIRQTGNPVKIYRRPASRAVGELLANANVLEGRVRFAGAGEFIAETPLGEVRGALADAALTPVPDTEITLLIRPESLHLDVLPPEENAFAGMVTGGDFLGAAGVLFFRAEGGVELRVMELNPRTGGGGLAGNGRLYAWVAPEDVTGIVAPRSL
jgi:ABC-type Fe3+/spermidine/putrescine transport system ATPase subunit